jgi:hypothetical protein
MIRIPNNHTLISIYNNLMVGLKAPTIGFYVDILLMVNYFRSQIAFILKRLIYGLIAEQFPIYIKKNVLFTESNLLSINFFYDQLHKEKYNFLVDILQQLEPQLRQKIKKIKN